MTLAPSDSNVAGMFRAVLRRFKCRRAGHAWDVDDGCRRTCSRCGRYEMLMMAPYPSLDQPALSWSHIDG